MNEAIEKRISHRCFSKEPVRASDVLQIQKWIAEVNEESSLDIEYLADGNEAFNDIKKSYGMFSNVRSMLLMKGCSGDENLDVKIGYYGEDLVLKMTQLNLGTCWVGGHMIVVPFPFLMEKPSSVLSCSETFGSPSRMSSSVQ